MGAEDERSGLMRWHRIEKQGKQRPAHGSTYRDWKEDLAKEGHEQCVYCAISERGFGGRYNFHVEHFEPKSLAPHRTNEWANLFYSCAICNVFKGKDWPLPGGSTAYLDPSLVEYELEFTRNSDGSISGVSANASYMVERLNLNRPQLRFERLEAELHERHDRAHEQVTNIRKSLKNTKIDRDTALTLLERILERLQRAHDAEKRLRGATPYQMADVRR